MLAFSIPRRDCNAMANDRNLQWSHWTQFILFHRCEFSAIFNESADDRLSKRVITATQYYIYNNNP